MAPLDFIFFRRKLFFSRIYRLFLAVAWVSALTCPLYSQEINSFRTAASGVFNDLAIWEVYDGSNWGPASTIPDASTDIYINQSHTLSLTTSERVKSLFINSEAGAEQKLLLNGNALEIFGTLEAFSGPAPGVPTGTWNSQNWIGNSIDSRLVFRGNSRTIIPRGAWSGFSTQSRYSVIFDPGEGVDLTIEEHIKSMRFIIRSGTVIQELDTSVLPNRCATLSFNSENFFGLNEFGDLIIENGGTLLSKCNTDILFRSASRSAARLELAEGGELILEGSNPEMEVFQYQLNGKLTFSAGMSNKSFVTRSFASSSLPEEVHDLEIRSDQNLLIPANLSVSGDLIQSGTGQFDFSGTSLEFVGPDVQDIVGFPLITLDLTLDKPAGEVLFSQDVAVLSQLSLVRGGLSLQGNDLSVNLLGTGGIDYQDGYWRQLGNLTHFNVPMVLTATNFTLPFLDQFQGGIRKIQLLGNSPGGALQLSFSEFSGAEFDPQFSDSDGTPILYRLHSFFNFTGLTPSADPVELRISSIELIVDQVDDLRIVGTGYAAPGSHQPGLDPTLLWARRSLTFGELEDTDFTVGSTRPLSILPVRWLDVSAQTDERQTHISWKVARELDNDRFVVERSKSGLSDWVKIGEIPSLGDTEEVRSYTFADQSRNKYQNAYYRIRQIDHSGSFSFSDLAKAKGTLSEELKIFPNPHTAGPIEIVFPKEIDLEHAFVRVVGTQSTTLYESELQIEQLKSRLQALSPGIYTVQVYSQTQSYAVRLLKK